MRTLPLMIGIFIVLISIPGYLYSPMIITSLIHSTMSTFGTGSTGSSSSILKQMGYPSRTVVISMMQYSFVGMEVAGVGLLFFGFVAKKKVPKKIAPKIVAETQIAPNPAATEKIQPNPAPTEKVQPNLRSIRILEERLAKGEITPIQFQSLKKLLE